MEKSNLPIGVFDSGVGGISTLRELVALMPQESFLYYGDDAHAPYGTRSTEEVRRLTADCIAELIDADVKAVVLACNTATAAAAAYLRVCYPELPIIGAEPALKPAVVAGHQKIAVMATPTTLRESKFRALAERFGSQAQIVSLPALGLVELIERDIRGAELEALLRTLLAPVVEEGIDALVLGCTHYPFVRQTIQSILGDKVTLYDGNRGIALQTARTLEQLQLKAQGSAPKPLEERVSFYQNGQRAEYFALAKRLLEL